jgi:hypothetical protein
LHVRTVITFARAAKELISSGARAIASALPIEHAGAPQGGA